MALKKQNTTATVKKKIKSNPKNTNAIAAIKTSFNNTLVTITDMDGNVIAWSSSGAVGQKNSRKSTPFAAGEAAEAAGKKAFSHGVRTLEIRVKGPGPGRDAAIRSLQALNFDISSLTDTTPIPHNGCRPPKRPRK